MKPDADLQQHVMRELEWDTHVDETAIGVSVHHGIVTLHGTVGSWAEKHTAEEAVHRIAGVLDVANDIEIKPSWRVERSDTEIAEAVRNALAWDVFIPHTRIKSTVCDQGHVVLTGGVATLRERDDAERVVRNLEGVRLVTNEIRIEVPKVEAGALRHSIEQALERHVAREASHIAIDVRGDTIVLTGTVASWSERRAAVGAAKGTPGVARIDDRLEVHA